MKKLIFTLLMVSFGCSAMFAQTAKRIAFLHDPTVRVQQVGIEAALRGEGYTVDVSYTPFDTVSLAGYDLIIVSRGASSGDFVQYLTWNRIPKPILILSAFAVRDSRMRFLNGQEVSPEDSSLIDPNLITKAVPIANKDGITYDSVFNNVSKNGATFPYFKGMYCYLDYYLSDFNLDANNGKLLVVLSDSATAGPGSITMVRWEAGVEAYAGTGILAGRRSYMDIGTDDNTAAEHFNMDNYTATSLTLFLNEVKFLMGISIPKWINAGVNEFKNASQFNVYPNPSSNGTFIIDISEAKLKTTNIQIYSITGQLVYAKDFKLSGNISINSGLNKGMYLMVVNVDGNKLTRKIVIN